MPPPTPELSELTRSSRDNLMTLQSHLLAEEVKHEGEHGALSWILSALSLSAKVISAKMRRARIDDVLGALDSDNVQGERQQKLDVIANETLLRCLGGREGVAIVASEENEEPVVIAQRLDGQGRYCVLFDPLDGSSNLDTCGGVGTIFSILRYERGMGDPKAALLQPGREQVAAGYMLYGSSTVFVLDTVIGAFVRVADQMRIPSAGKTYSLNEGNRPSMPEGYRKYLEWAQASGYSSRYAGAMVADVHRTLIQGGVFLYPPTKKAPKGKLRLMYEASPMAMVLEQAGGRACAGKERLLDVTPRELHERTSVVMGSPDEVGNVLRFL